MGLANPKNSRAPGPKRAPAQDPEITSDEVEDIFERIREYRGLRSLTDQQVRNLALLLERLELGHGVLEGPERDTRVAITAHVSPGFNLHFKQLALEYGLSPSNLARVVLAGFVVSSEHPDRPGREPIADDDL